MLSFKTSEENHEVVRTLTRKFPGAKENVVARFAIAYSISQGRKLPLDSIKDSKGKEYDESTLFGKYSKLYIALICQHYEINQSDETIQKRIKLHLDDGLELMSNFFKSNQNHDGLDFLMPQIERGLLSFEDISRPVDYVSTTYERDSFLQVLRLKVGSEVSSGKEIFFTLNDTHIRPNAHIAIAGKSGTGKTSFALKLLTQVYEQSYGKVNFIYVDFKGLDSTNLSEKQHFFLEKTKCQLIDLPSKAFPINPLSFIDQVNESNKTIGIRKFTDIITSLDKKLGARQSIALIESTKDCFANNKFGTYPTLKDIYKRLLDNYDKSDSLTSLLQGLTEVKLFDENNSSDELFQKNIYLSLSPSLPTNIRLTATILIINYLYNIIMRMNDTPDDNGIKGIRYVILIDEAHQVFKERRVQQLLDDILRMVRSKGISVMLLSQGIAEFDTPDFNFSDNCSTAFLLDINDKGNLRPIEKFLGLSSNQRGVITANLGKILNYQAISNIKEYQPGQLFNIL